jgi:hypothetical protein
VKELEPLGDVVGAVNGRHVRGEREHFCQAGRDGVVHGARVEVARLFEASLDVFDAIARRAPGEGEVRERAQAEDVRLGRARGGVLA